MKDFQFTIPQKTEFGVGILKKLPVIIGDTKEHIFVISDRGLEAIGAVKKIEDILKQADISYTLFLDVLQNPTITLVEEVVAAFKISNATKIIAFGGGSPIDVAKAVGVLGKYGGDIRDYFGNHKVPGSIIPTIAIPTTAGTGSEATASCVITDEKTQFKTTIFSYEIIPSYAILDPELIMSTPPHIAAACGIDAFIHAMEAYLSNFSSPFSDAMAEKAMTLIGESLREFVSNPSNSEAASNMMIGSNLAGISFAWARLGNVHALSHPVSGYFNVPHGLANAILLPKVVEFNLPDEKGRYKVIYRSITKTPVEDFKPELLVEELTALNQTLNIPSSLSAVGVKVESIDAMAVDAMKSANVLANTRETTLDDVKEIYHKSM